MWLSGCFELSHKIKFKQSFTDLLKETIAAARPHSRQSKASRTSDKPRSEKSGKCPGRKNRTDQEELELTPSLLPNASPSEVVSDWLRSIPADSSMLALGDELHEEVSAQQRVVEEKPEEEAAKEEEERPDDEKVNEEEKVEDEGGEEKQDEEECRAAEEEESSDPAHGQTAETSACPDTLTRNLNSSASVMKVLLSSSLGRCQSMPEVSQ